LLFMRQADVQPYILASAFAANGVSFIFYSVIRLALTVTGFASIKIAANLGNSFKMRGSANT